MARFVLIFFFFSLFILPATTAYTPDWDSLDSRPLPSWYDEGKLGIFCHWGVYSVPAFETEWFWERWKISNDSAVVKFISDNYKKDITYADFGRDFAAEHFDAIVFRQIVESSGARYFVLTSKHHEGYTLWPSATSWNWNALDLGPKRDLVKELADAFAQSKVHFGLYFSLYEWFHPLYLEDKKNNRSTRYTDEIMYPQLLEIVNGYRPQVIWSDGEWEKSETYWKSKDFLAWLYNDSPIKDFVVVNDRWGAGTAGHHGGFLTYSDHFDPGHLLPRKWENCMTLDSRSWGYRRNMRENDIRTTHELIEQLARTISCGGNLLLNVGPTQHGTIAPLFELRLKQLGAFVSTNAEAIYGTKPWVHQNDSNVWYTSRLRSRVRAASSRVFNPQKQDDTIIYAFVLDFFKIGPNSLQLNSVKYTDQILVEVLGGSKLKTSKASTGGTIVDLGSVSWSTFPSLDVAVLRIEYAGTSHHDPVKALIKKGVLAQDGSLRVRPKRRTTSKHSH